MLVATKKSIHGPGESTDDNTGMRRRMDAIFAGLLILCACAAVKAQTCEPGELRVLVKDSQEAPIYSAKVRVGSDATEVATQTTQTSGVTEFEHVPCGAWSVKATKDGFDGRIFTSSGCNS